MVAERAALTASERGLDFAENGQGDFLAASVLILSASAEEKRLGPPLFY